MINTLFEHFVEASPLTVMMRAIMERIFAADKLDALFEQVADRQYTRTLLFSSVVGLMGWVVSGIHPSVSAAYKALEQVIGVSRPALYGKLNGLEPGISQALVRYSDAELRPLVEALGGASPSPLPGYTIRIADGNLLGPTDHRLAVLRPKRAGALPGKSIAVLDPQTHLVSDVFPCDDAHAQERSLLPAVLATVSAHQVWIADRNFCTAGFLCGIAERQGYFVIRAHQNLPWQTVGPLTEGGPSATGTVCEQPVQLATQQGHDLALRRVVVRLNQPTRHGDGEVVIFTNLPIDVADARTVADLYLSRWSIEEMFQVITDVFSCELNTLGYPKAALFAFCMAVVAFNSLSTLKAALKAVHGIGKIEAGLSDFYVVEEVQGIFRGMMIALPPPLWQPFADMPVSQFAQTLTDWATHVDLKRFASSPRGPKKPPQKEALNRKQPHVATARLLKEKQNKRSP
jgi:hypothetical protein